MELKESQDLKKLAKLPTCKPLIDILLHEVYQPIKDGEPTKLGRRELALEILQMMEVIC